jgi:type IV pilus assembly protein PilA
VRDTCFSRRRAPRRAQDGFTLIEVLVVVLIIGILAAIAIPSFLSQKHKADDAGAVSLARNAETAMESYGASNSGSYSGATASSLHSIEPAIDVTSNTTDPYVSSVTANVTDYTLVVASPMSTGSFTLTKSGNSITRSCTGTGGGCVGGSW